MRSVGKLLVLVIVMAIGFSCTALMLEVPAKDTPKQVIINGKDLPIEDIAYQVAVCNWENFEQWGHDGFNWRWMGCNLSLHGQYQCRGGPNTDECYTVAEARYLAAAFRAWTGAG
jgi:hypothetical protein